LNLYSGPPPLASRNDAGHLKARTVQFRLTLEILQRLSDSVPPDLNEKEKALAVAAGILRGFLGSEWVEKHVI
jgi:hypothetical protein